MTPPTVLPSWARAAPAPKTRSAPKAMLYLCPVVILHR
jgi:hypothetical protein